MKRLADRILQRVKEGYGMTVYIGFLRGINVGGNKMIKMAELKNMLEVMEGINRVRTHLNSGNVLFESKEEADRLRRRIEDQIRTAFGMSVTVILRTAGELERIVHNCPFPSDSLAEGESIHLCLLTEETPQEKLDRLSESISEKDEYRIAGREIYLHFRQSILDSKLASNVQKLGNTTTMRNWNTIMKLDAIAKSMHA
jgi:uncharacterized protein (DUF1697 family)